MKNNTNINPENLNAQIVGVTACKDEHFHISTVARMLNW